MELVSIGRTLKAHGKDGALRIQCDDEFLEDLSKARAVFLDLDGSRVPFLISNFEIKNHILIYLDEVVTPEDASLYSLKDLYLERSELSASSLEAVQAEDHGMLLQFRVYDGNDNYMGTITEFIENPQQLLIRVSGPEHEFLCPLHDELILGIEEESMILKMSIPDGLVDL